MHLNEISISSETQFIRNLKLLTSVFSVESATSVSCPEAYPSTSMPGEDLLRPRWTEATTSGPFPAPPDFSEEHSADSASSSDLVFWTCLRRQNVTAVRSRRSTRPTMLPKMPQTRGPMCDDERSGSGNRVKPFRLSLRSNSKNKLAFYFLNFFCYNII